MDHLDQEDMEMMVNSLEVNPTRLGLTNYGARGEMIKSFLRENGVEPHAGAGGAEKLETPDIVEEAMRFTGRVDCLK